MVTRRRNENGVRMQAGANTRKILTMVMREAVAAGHWAGGGAGIALAGADRRRSRPVQVEGARPRPGYVIAGMAVVALIASVLPAKAATVNPMVALRDE